MSQNFIDACEFLITERFVEEDEAEEKKKDQG